MALHASLEVRLVPLQQPGVTVVVGVSVVVISQTLKSSVSMNSQPLRSHCAWSLSKPRHLSFCL